MVRPVGGIEHLFPLGGICVLRTSNSEVLEAEVESFMTSRVP